MSRQAYLCVLVATVTASAAACTPKVDVTCEAALRNWLAAMEESENDSRRLKEAYALLGPETRASLETRATQKSARLGRRIQPFELFAEGRLDRAFEPVAFEETKDERGPVVRVRGRAKEEAHVRCSYEGKGARIELEGVDDPDPR